MFKTIISNLLKNWEFVLFAIIITAAIATYYTQKGLISHYKTLYTDQKNYNEILQSNNDILKEALINQNKNIEKMKNESISKDLVLKQLQKDIDINLQKMNDMTKKLKEVPPPSSCHDSINYLRTLGDYIKWENI